MRSSASLRAWSPTTRWWARLEKLGLCDEDFDDLALEAVRGGKGGAAMASRVAEHERHGHATGDLVLTEVARQLSIQVVGRVGGDEIAVWVPGGPGRGDEAASAVLSAVGAAFAGERDGLQVGVSIGAASRSVRGLELRH
jgi:hypothetical protein